MADHIAPHLPAAALDGDLTALSALRGTLTRWSAELEHAFLDGRPVTELIATRAQLIDELLIAIWGAAGLPATQAALVAVGGYGRGELHPHSDVDVMVLLEGDARERLADHLERLLRLLWDLGLKVGSSVRTLEECIEESVKDVTVATNLMESRLLAGDAPLFEAMRAATDRDHVWPSRDFFQAKLEEQERRHHRFHDAAYNLEPNIKEGPGGLRDLSNIGWVAKRHFGADSFRDLITHAFLTDEEYAELMQCQEFLWRVRFALHALAGRAEERLLFDFQRPLAERLGYRDEPHRLAVEAFMHAYYRTVDRLSRLNEMLLQLFREEIVLADSHAPPVPINKRFQALGGYLEARHPKVFEHTPSALLEIYLVLAERPELKGIRASTIRLIRTHLHLIDDRFRSDFKIRSLFLEFLRQPRGIYHELRRMHRHGVLGAYLPLFGKVAGQMQYDLFHVYTVDEHTLFVVRNLRRFSDPLRGEEVPLASRVAKQLPKPELLYIAGLFHDIAKGRGGDHSELGADEVEHFCLQHMLPIWDTRLVTWLVKHHLIMSATAQRKDIDDPEVVNDFAFQVGDQTRLDYLYLLTVADIRATNPELWNSWKGSLLGELYHSTRRALRRGLENPLNRDEQIAQIRAEARALLLQSHVEDIQITALWARLGDDHTLRHTPSEIAWQGSAILACAEGDLPLVAIRPEHERGGTALFLYARDEDGLFAITTSVLEQSGLDILDARIVDLPGGFTLNTYIVLDETGQPLAEGPASEQVCAALRQRLLHRAPPPARSARRLPRRHKHIPVPTTVHFFPDPRGRCTVMELYALDRPGLLSEVGQAFLDQGIRLHSAKVATIGHRAEDVFYVTDRNNRPIDDPERLNTLRSAIEEHLDTPA